LRGARRLDGYEVIEFGRPYPLVVSALHSAADAVGARAMGFSDMSAEEVARRCGLPIAQACRAKRREYDEPFIVDDGDVALRPLLHRCLVDRGLRCTSGGRFDHVTGATDKARAAGVLRMLYHQADHRRIVTVGLGDAPNDACLLREVQIPVIIRQRAGREQTRRLLSAVPHSRVSRRAGPQGWNEQIEEIVELVA
jgi:mannosyl-3-phosphoglycerate phosphatase